MRNGKPPLKGECIKQAGLKLLSTIPDLAEKELKTHTLATKTFVRELVKKHGLSETAATYCSKDILHHQETHGEKPSSEQMGAMVQISRQLDKESYPSSMGSHNIEYLRRRDGEVQFREMTSQGKDLSRFMEFPHKEKSYDQIQLAVKKHEEEKTIYNYESSLKSMEIGFSI